MEKIVVKTDNLSNNMFFLSCEDRDNWLKTHQINNEVGELAVCGVWNSGFLIIFKNALYAIGKNTCKRFSDESEETVYKKPYLMAQDVICAVGSEYCSIYVTTDGKVHFQSDFTLDSRVELTGFEDILRLTDIKDVYSVQLGGDCYCFIDIHEKIYAFSGGYDYRQKKYVLEKYIPSSKILRILKKRKTVLYNAVCAEDRLPDNAKKVIYINNNRSNLASMSRLELDKNGTVALYTPRFLLPVEERLFASYTNIVDIAVTADDWACSNCSFLFAEKNGVFHYIELSWKQNRYVIIAEYDICFE